MIEELLEIENKYSADNISLQSFLDLMVEIGYKERKDSSSFDTYFVKPGVKTDFQRFRNSETPELTRKIKTSDKNNFRRVEIDLPLDPKRVSDFIITQYLKLEGYEKNFKIFKNCFIFYLDKVNLVYYITMDENLKELNRFIEVEYNKPEVKVDGVEVASKTVKQYEQKLFKLGITPQHRLRKSLFELYYVEK